MSTIDIQNQILDAIETIVTNEVQNASFDKTIQATISKVVDQSTGKYLVKYQDSAFYAYATSTDVSYTVGALVYVLVPGNDMSNDKTIIGSVDNLGTNYLNLISNSDKFEPTGENLASSTDSFGLCSYKETDSEILYSREQDINLIGLDPDAAAIYLNRSNYLKLGASFQTNLDKKQKYSGNYGIIFKIKYKDNDTGANLIRVYTIDIDDMNGDPYNFTTAVAQSKYYEITEEFVSIEEVSIFSESFPYTEDNKADDIFVTDLVISGGDLLDDEALEGSSLTLLALQGDFFTDTIISDKTLTAQVRIKGNVVDADSDLLEYYWFKENNAITIDSAGYNRLAGKGWECLNDYTTTTLEDSSIFVTYVSGSSTYTVTKAKNLAKENVYKCVVVYNDDVIITREKTIYNYSSEYDITIESDGGTHFYFGAGYPNLTCLVNGAEDTDKTYYWSTTTSDGTFSLLEETTDDNETYNTAKAAYEELEAEIAAETVFVEQVQDQLDVLQATMNQYNTVLRIEDNHAYRVPIREIINYTIYKCSVYSGDDYIGTASITLFNSLDISQHNLIITNGDQVFKYDEAGTTPANPALDDPVTVLPLGFNFYNNEGTLISHDAINLSEVIWQIPKMNTLISIPIIYSDNLDSEDDDYYYYTGIDEISFTIKDKYNVNSQNNTVKLTVCYKGEYFIAESTLTFIKEGESGTNGTDFICKIVANATDEDFTDYPTVLYDTSTSTYSLNYTPVSADYWFKAQLWEDTEMIYEGYQSTGNGTGNNVTDSTGEFDLSWKILYNNYGDGHTDDKLFDVVEGHVKDETTGEINYDEFNSEQGKMSLNTDYISQNNVAMILECQITYNGKVYYADLPIIFAVVSSSDYSISWDRGTGFRYAVYTTDGQSPQYDFANPFEVTVKQKIDDDMIDISTLAASSYTVDFDWSVYGTTWTSGAEVESNDLILKKVSSLPRNQKRILPAETSDGLCLTDNILCIVSRDDTELARILMPIHLYLNKYGNALLNGWNGNSISINDDEGIILTPQVGAGKKESDNSFTGILMGSVQKSADSDIESGLFGFYKGEQTLELNAETGQAKFGKTGKGQIIIDPSSESEQALIYGGDYDEDAGTGMVINLTEPSIKWGSGNFSVDKDGYVSATGFATSSAVNDLKLRMDEMEDDIEYFTVSAQRTSIFVQVNSDNEVLTSGSSTIETWPRWKNQLLTSGVSVSVTKDPSSTPLTCSADLSNLVISYTEGSVVDDETLITVTYTYTDSASESHSVEITYSVVASIQSAVTIADTTITYQVSNDGVNIPTGAWETSIPEDIQGLYLWTKTVISYTDGNSSTFYTVSYSSTDNSNIQTGVEYCLGKSSTTPPDEDDEGWTTGLMTSDPGNGIYAWSRTYLFYINSIIDEEGNITYEDVKKYFNYNCVLQIYKQIISQVTQYLLSDSADEQPPEEGYYEGDDEEGNPIYTLWAVEKPTQSNSERPYLWTRLATTYQNSNDVTTEGTWVEYSNYYIDSLWNQLFDIDTALSSSILSILSRIGSGGVVKIESGYIVVADDATTPNNIIFISGDGIGFIQYEKNPWEREDEENDAGWPVDLAALIDSATSTWSINGQLNMQGINVVNLVATSIANEYLELGYNPDNEDIEHGQVTGDLDIYDSEGKKCFETVVDSDTNYIEGFKVYKYTEEGNYNGFIFLSREGIREYGADVDADSTDSTNWLYGNDGSGAWDSKLATTQELQVYSSDNTYGIDIRPMTMNNHQGIGFIKRS